MKTDRLYLLHICECASRIEQYCRGGKDVFFQDVKTQDAVLRNLHTLSESTQRLSKTLKEAHPEIDWRGLSGFRNVLVHDYLGINLVRVWELVERDIPALKRGMEAILNDLGAS